MAARVIIAGGGTFGHIAPALSLKNLFEKEGATVYYICAERDKKFPFYQKTEFLLTLKLHGLPRKNIWSLVKFIFLLLRAVIQSLTHIIKIRPMFIISTGGFISFPYLFWAFLLRIRFYICEQNSFPGIVNRIFSRFAKKVFISMQDYSKKLKGNLILSGNPVSVNKYSINEAEKILKTSLIPGKKVLGVIGGSQGAIKINQWILKNQETLENEGFQIILSTGTSNYQEILKEKRIDSLLVYGFIQDMGAFYSLCDIFISRGGASTIAELLLFNKPAIFIPYPYATDNHQYYNSLFASEFLNSKIILEEDMGKTNLVAAIQEVYHTISKNKKDFSKSGEIILQEIKKNGSL